MYFFLSELTFEFYNIDSNFLARKIIPAVPN